MESDQSGGKKAKEAKLDNSVLDQYIDYRENPHGWRDRKARMQITFSTKKAMERAKPNIGDASIYNIWYNNWYQANRKGASDQIPFTKCNPAADSGITRGSQLHKEDGLFCVHFAKGSCAKGHDCSYLHRIPIPADEKRIDRTRDVFGRERHRLDRDDMGGVGSFERENRTLYIGKVGTYEDVQDVVRKHFRQFGEIEYMKVLHSKNVVFVKYKSRLSAEFAKEAMNSQSLEHGECLNVRWATEDPNPNAIHLNTVEAKQQMLDTVLTQPAYTQNLGVYYDNQTEGDLNQYYEQQQLDYQAYFETKAGGFAAGQVAQASGRGHLIEQAKQQKIAAQNSQSNPTPVLVFTGASTKGGPPPPPPKKAPPPPPPRKVPAPESTVKTAESAEKAEISQPIGKRKQSEAEPSDAEQSEDTSGRKSRRTRADSSTSPPKRATSRTKSKTRSDSPARKASVPANTGLALVAGYASSTDEEGDD